MCPPLSWVASSPLNRKKHVELHTPLSVQASCSSHFHSSVAHGWEEKSKCHHVHLQPAAWVDSLVLPFLPTTRHSSSGLHTPLPFTFSSHFRQPSPKPDQISPGTDTAQGGGITPLFLPHTASLESQLICHLSTSISLSPACCLHAVDSVNGICQVSG